jgi:endonuclease/exonuclease/phosphatase family metal-dependent hydrolase
MKLYTWLKYKIYQLLFGVNLFLGLLMFLVYLAPFTPPSQIYLISVLALGYPYLLFAHIAFITFWIYKRKRYVYFSCIVLIVGYVHFNNLFSFHQSSSSTKDDALRIMSYNVRYFNVPYLSNESALIKAQNNIFEVIGSASFDVFCGQEFSGKSSFYNQRVQKFMQRELQLNYNYFGGGSSLSIYSKHPIINQGSISFEDSFNGAIFADIQYQNKVVRIYCLHLQSVGLGNDENELFDKNNLSKLNRGSTQEKYKRISFKLKRAFLKREKQAEQIKEHMNNCPYPFVLAGDLNDTPSSYAYAVLSDHLKDAFTNKGLGFGSTYAGLLPLLRIDCILYSKEWYIDSFETLDKTSSDHYPILSKAHL